jgi:hypothetical protein
MSGDESLENDGKVKPDKEISQMLNVAKKKMEIQKGPKTLDDAAMLMIAENRRRIKEEAEIEA